MITRLVLRLPWFLSTPAIVAAAIVLAAGTNLVAGTYFERTFVDEADPFAGLDLAPTSVAPTATASPSVTPPVAAPAPVAAAPAAPAQATPAASPEPVPQASVGAPAGPVLLAEGTFVDGDPGHNGEGTARLIQGPDGSHVLRLENFSVTNGPDLFVILSTDPSGSRSSAGAADALNLGRLRATDGNINYAVPAGVEAAIYRSVIIYCRAFRVVFAVATLEAP
jgi:hypothetical protein